MSWCRIRTLVCSNGQPSAGLLRLLDLLLSDGTTFRYPGDFDRGGIRIGNTLQDRISWEPWRFDAAAYSSTTAAGGTLVGKPADATWDPELRPALE
ncbi:DUF2399 domain-containing protein [Amycolatopsis japonica]|uniref:DUF2399 domain-containing protein n=1 Tax=Amycolatopsis japonica TaxID=208439 RepID=UPI00379B3127